MSFRVLQNRTIIDILIGDVVVYEDYRLPYYSGSKLCELSTMFGLPKTYVWGGQNLSRWEYMRDLLSFVEKSNKMNDLLLYLFTFQRFESLDLVGTTDEIKTTYSNIVNGAIAKINEKLLFSGVQLRVLNNQFVLLKTSEEVVVEAPKVKIVTYQYIQELPERIKDDLKNKDYDSVVTKSRTLLEEVFIYIIEKSTKERYSSKGNIQLIYAEVKDLLNIKPQGDWDKRVCDLINGINKIIEAIGKMRNMNSDAHGVGQRRIDIREREARLIASSAIMISEYMLSIYLKDRD